MYNYIQYKDIDSNYGTKGTRHIRLLRINELLALSRFGMLI